MSHRDPMGGDPNDFFDLLFGRPGAVADSQAAWKPMFDQGFKVDLLPRSPDYVQLHIKERLTTEYGVSWAVGLKVARLLTGLPETPGDDILARNVPLAHYPLLVELSQVDGIIQAAVVPYAITVTKSPAFTWDELVVPLKEAWTSYKLKQEFNAGEV